MNIEIPKWPRLPEGADKRKKLSEADKEKIKMLRMTQGLSDRVIAGIMGINHSTVRYWLGDKERQNAKTIRRLKEKPPSKEVLKERRIKNRDHHFEIIGTELVRTFRREHRRATRSLYTDFRKVCENSECPGRVLTKEGWSRGHRYSGRIHKTCPKCKK